MIRFLFYVDSLYVGKVFENGMPSDKMNHLRLSKNGCADLYQLRKWQEKKRIQPKQTSFPLICAFTFFFSCIICGNGNYNLAMLLKRATQKKQIIVHSHLNNNIKNLFSFLTVFFGRQSHCGTISCMGSWPRFCRRRLNGKLAFN